MYNMLPCIMQQSHVHSTDYTHRLPAAKLMLLVMCRRQQVRYVAYK